MKWNQWQIEAAHSILSSLYRYCVVAFSHDLFERCYPPFSILGLYHFRWCMYFFASLSLSCSLHLCVSMVFNFGANALSPIPSNGARDWTNRDSLFWTNQSINSFSFSILFSEFIITASCESYAYCRSIVPCTCIILSRRP